MAKTPKIQPPPELPPAETPPEVGLPPSPPELETPADPPANPALTPQIDAVTITLPLLKDVTLHGFRVPRKFSLRAQRRLSLDEGHALAALQQALILRGETVGGRPIKDNIDALRWILKRTADALADDRGTPPDLR